MRLHVETLFLRDDRGRLTTVNEPGGGVAPRLFLGLTARGLLSRFRADLDASLVAELKALIDAADLRTGLDPDAESLAPIVRRLERDAPVTSVWAGPAFRFPESPSAIDGAIRVTPRTASVLTPRFEEWSGDVRAGVPFRAIVEDGSAVSICCTVRASESAHEAGVETDPEFRGQGLAARVVSAWAFDVRAMGLVPLYSTSWQNRASCSVARKLGLLRYGVDLHVT